MDGGTANASFSMYQRAFVIDDVNLVVTHWHWDHRQVRMSLVHPDGTSVVVFEPEFGPFLQDTARGYLSTPYAAFDALKGKSVEGDWKLVFDDLSSDGHSGHVRKIELKIMAHEAP